MTELMGHLGMALLWATPAWFLWEPRVALAFVGLTLTTAMLPDVDLALRLVLPVHHHGITHTIVFVLVFSVIVGAIVEYALGPRIEALWLRRRGYVASDRALFVFVTGAFALGGLSHLFTDMLSAPDIAEPIEPFWPFFDKPWSVDVIYYGSMRANVSLLLAGLLIHAALAYVDFGIDHPYQISRET